MESFWCRVVSVDNVELREPVLYKEFSASNSDLQHFTFKVPWKYLVNVSVDKTGGFTSV